MTASLSTLEAALRSIAHYARWPAAQSPQSSSDELMRAIARSDDILKDVNPDTQRSCFSELVSSFDTIKDLLQQEASNGNAMGNVWQHKDSHHNSSLIPDGPKLDSGLAGGGRVPNPKRRQQGAAPEGLGPSLHNSNALRRVDTSAFPYPLPPYITDMESWYFVGVLPWGDAPRLPYPDPDLEYVTGPGLMELTRFKTSPWGAWDQVGLQTLPPM
jgi:hypothetical protein